MRSSRLMLVAASAALLVLAMAGCSRASDQTGGGTGLSPSERAASIAVASTSASDSAAVKLAGTAGAATSPATGNGSGTGTPGSENNAATPGSPSPATPVKPGAKAGMTVMILFWNDTSSKKLSGTQIRIGSATYKPNTSEKKTRGSLGPVAFDKRIELVVYPDGPRGKRIVVPLTVNRQMVSNSEQDGIHVAISDGTVRVLGNAVLNLDGSQPRF